MSFGFTVETVRRHAVEGGEIGTPGASVGVGNFPGSLTLAAFVDEVWAPRARRRLAPKTWARDSIVYEKHVRSALGGLPIVAIDVEVLVEWQDGLERRPLIWGPVVVERVRFDLLAGSRRIGRGKRLAAMRDALLVSLMEMTGCRPGEALGLRWSDIGERIAIARRLSGKDVVEGTKTGRHRSVPLLRPLRVDLDRLRRLSGDGASEYVFRTPAGAHWVETDWRNYRSRHFRPALERVEAGWDGWRADLADPAAVRESVAGLASTRPYDLGRHTHSALMLASGMSLQRLARIQGHGIRILDEAYSEQLAEFEERGERIEPVREIEAARELVWAESDDGRDSPYDQDDGDTADDAL